MERIAELIGVIMIGYGLWFGFRGLRMHFSADKSWWRQLSHRERYPYPAAGVLLSAVFVLGGMVFLLNYVVPNAAYFGYAAGITFILVLVVGVWQPRILHPRWYRDLEDRVGKSGLQKLKTAAYEMPTEEWRQVIASDAEFEAWVSRTLPAQPRRKAGRGYRKG